MNGIQGVATPIATTAGFSVLKATNKQPELALQLLIETLAGTQSALETPKSVGSGYVHPQGIGGNVNTVA